MQHRWFWSTVDVAVLVCLLDQVTHVPLPNLWDLQVKQLFSKFHRGSWCFAAKAGLASAPSDVVIYDNLHVLSSLKLSSR